MILINIYYKNPDSYRLLFTAGSFSSTTSPFSNDPEVQRVQRVRMEGSKPTHACRVLVCRGALELYYSRIEYNS